MSQIAEMFRTSNERMRKLMDGLSRGSLKPDMEIIASMQREFEGQVKALNTVVQAYGIASKNKRTLQGLSRMNLMDDTEAINLLIGPPEEDKIKCRDMGIITRQECLDRSGSGECYELCRDCEIGKQTRKVCTLIDPDEAFRQDKPATA